MSRTDNVSQVPTVMGVIVHDSSLLSCLLTAENDCVVYKHILANVVRGKVLTSLNDNQVLKAQISLPDSDKVCLADNRVK